MKKIQALALFLMSLLMCYSASLHAEDIDIYVSNSANVGTPNVLFVIDNGADFSANSSNGCSAYTGTTTAPSTGTSNTSGVLQCALVNAINSLQMGAVNIGVMVSNGQNFANTQTTTDQTRGGYHETCVNVQDGGCLLRKLTPMDATGKANLIAFIKGWQISNSNGGNTADQFLIKQNQSNQAEVMQEAWAYYNGKTGLSGKTYSPSILANGCQKNFVVYISNTQKDPSSSESSTAFSALSSPQVAATSAQLQAITGTIKFSSTICAGTTKATTSYTLTSGNNWADEWARLMYGQDGGASSNFGTQNIVTYSIGIQSSGSQCSTDTYGLIASMAKNGGGKFFQASSVTDLTDDLNNILNEVQAVNSVFSSASLPVSVNAQGTYLNQIYLGMFRPDATASPRWLGNLKQYKLAPDSTGALVLADSTGASAISASGTGFISPTAVSYWTYKTTGTSPDSLGGFFVNNPEGTPASGFDSPDGEVVEKGGSAQQIRKENLTATFTGSSNTSGTNPRRLYTYCPAGSSCVADLTNAANDFSTANSNIASSAFGSSTSIKINSITAASGVATVTTNGAHGLSTGATVTISNANQSDYNGTKTITVPSGSTNTFTFTVPDYPTTPAAGTYFITTGGAPVTVTSVTRSSSASSTANTETVTVTTSAAHGFTTASKVVVSGVSPSNYYYTGLPASVPTTTTFTYNVAITPTATAVNTYTVGYAPGAYAAQSVSLTNPNTGELDGTTTAAHGFHVGESITITGATSNSKYKGTYTITAIPDTKSFQITGLGNGVKNYGGETGTVTPDTTTMTVTTLKRTGTTTTSTATATGLTSNWLGLNTGDTATVNVAQSSGNTANETEYVVSNVTATCQNSGCTTITYPITVNPSTTTTLTSATASLAGSASANVAAGAITRSGTTATVSGLTANTFSNGQSVTITATGTTYSTESAYLGTWTLSCSSTCTSFTFGPVALTPATPGTGANMQLFTNTAPDRDTVIKWLRGQDNYGDELGPGGSVTVRPSIHADVLHSRPFVVNYGGASDKIVVYYGTNDGVFHAVNGNQSAAISGIPAGDELWGLVLTDHYNKINRQRVASPELKFPTTTLSTATSKDYFVDGPTGAYQKLNSDGTINTAYIFLTMRRGGNFIYALDVSDPLTPKFLWKIDTNTAGFSGLGQTWSRPRLTLLQSSAYNTTPVLIFGGGYDTNEDSEPPGTDTQGRGIYIINAATGALIFTATQSVSTCPTGATCLAVPAMTYAIPSDITFVDRDNDGYTDKLYVGDLGGNIWRVDVADAAPANWKVTKIAALGCDTGVCASGTTPRKFFFPPAVLSIKSPGATGSFDAISMVSGDREHPLKSTNTSSAYFTVDRFFMVMDQTTMVNPSTYLTSGVLKTNLSSIPGDGSVLWDGSNSGFYITLATGEKGVNAPLAVNGNVFFSTNQPADPSATCIPNLGTARAYAVSPFTGQLASNVLSGGGLPPSPVAGLVSITTTNADGTTSSTEERFCIGCGLAAPPGSTGGGPTTCTGNAALQNCTPDANITSKIKRTYWYKK